MFHEVPILHIPWSMAGHGAFTSPARASRFVTAGCEAVPMGVWRCRSAGYVVHATAGQWARCAGPLDSDGRSAARGVGGLSRDCWGECRRTSCRGRRHRGEFGDVGARCVVDRCAAFWKKTDQPLSPSSPAIERRDQFLRSGQESFDPSALNSKLPLSDSSGGRSLDEPLWVRLWSAVTLLFRARPSRPSCSHR